MKLSKASTDAVDGWSNIHYDENRSGHFLIFAKKPTKKQESGLSQIFTAFGGSEVKKYRYEFTYDPRWKIAQALEYGYINNPALNYGFLPRQLEKAMFNLLIIPSGGRVLYPYYGYGYENGSAHNNYSIMNSFNDNDTEVSGLYDGMLFRSPLGNIKNAHIMFNELVKHLKDGASVSCIVDTSWLSFKSFDNMLYSNFHDVGKAMILSPTWIPSYSSNVIRATILHMKRGI